MSGMEAWARRTVARVRLSELTLCTDRLYHLAAVEYPEAFSPEEMADSVRAADVYASELRRVRRISPGGHVCSRCADVVVDE